MNPLKKKNNMIISVDVERQKSNAHSRYKCSLNWKQRKVSQVVQWQKNPPTHVGNAGDARLIPDREDLLEEEMATYSSSLAWKIPWAEESGRLQSTGLQRGGHD